MGALSLNSGAVVVAIVSALVSAGATSLHSKAQTWAVAILAPLAVAAALYWLPAVGAESSEYSEHFHWAPIFIVPWYVAGLLASVLVVTLLGRRRGRN